MNPQDEAQAILKIVINEFSTSTIDLVPILRQCQHVCEILCLKTEREWIHKELNGYFNEDQLPQYRIIKGYSKWEIQEDPFSLFPNIDSLKTKLLSPILSPQYDETINIYSGITWLKGAAQNGYMEKSQETQNLERDSGKPQLVIRKIRYFSAQVFAHSIFQIEKIIFDWVSALHVRLLYGNKVEGIWSRYRSVVDSAIQTLKISNHLSTIEDGINSANPESWRSAVLECRNLLRDVADYLWQDSRKTYIHLQGSDKTSKLNVEKGKYVNRLVAYLHQKSITGKEGAFLEAEANRLADSISSLNALASKGHEPIERPVADTIILSTYFIIGELAIKTDLVPIVEYK